MLTDTLFPYQTLFRSGIGIGEDVTGVEDVQPLVLHRPHVEVADRDDVEAVEVVLAAIGLLVAFHAVLQRRHRMMGAVQITFAHPDAAFDLAARQGGEAVAMDDAVARDTRDKIGGLGQRAFTPTPAGLVLAPPPTSALAVRPDKRD